MIQRSAFRCSHSLLPIPHSLLPLLLQGNDRRLSAIAQAQPTQNIGDMIPHRLLSKVERLGDFSIAGTLSNQLQDLLFSRREFCQHRR